MRAHSGRTIVAGAAYFGIVFICGFLLGTLRVIFVAPRLGTFAAVLIELPVMLAASWIVARWVCTGMKIPATLGDRLLMGALAFVLLMLAETILGSTLFGRNLRSQLDALATAAGLAGLLGQVAFAVIPCLLLLRPNRRS